jgi:predicted transcriptional regulator
MMAIVGIMKLPVINSAGNCVGSIENNSLAEEVLFSVRWTLIETDMLI